MYLVISTVLSALKTRLVTKIRDKNMIIVSYSISIKCSVKPHDTISYFLNLSYHVSLVKILIINMSWIRNYKRL